MRNFNNFHAFAVREERHRISYTIAVSPPQPRIHVCSVLRFHTTVGNKKKRDAEEVKDDHFIDTRLVIVARIVYL